METDLPINPYFIRPDLDSWAIMISAASTKSVINYVVGGNILSLGKGSRLPNL